MNAVHLVSLDVQEVLECVGAFLRLNKDQSEGIRPCRNVIGLLYITGFDLKCKLLKHRPISIQFVKAFRNLKNEFAV